MMYGVHLTLVYNQPLIKKRWVLSYFKWPQTLPPTTTILNGLRPVGTKILITYELLPFPTNILFIQGETTVGCWNVD